MGTVQAQANMSLDGYVAKHDNTIGRLFDWLQNGEAGLRFYWATNGQAPWHTETVAGPGTTDSGPSIAYNHGSVHIAAPGPGNSLMFYWAALGTGTWHPETVPGIGSGPHA